MSGMNPKVMLRNCHRKNGAARMILQASDLCICGAWDIGLKMPKGASGVSDLRLHVGMQDTETFGLGLRMYACDSVCARPSHATVHVRGMFGALGRQCQELPTQECFLHVFCLARSQNHQACEEDRAQSNELCKSTRKEPWTITASTEASQSATCLWYGPEDL